MKHFIFAAASAAMIAGGPALAQDYTLNTRADSAPNGETVFTFTIPFTLTDIHPDAVRLGNSCRVSIGLPMGSGGYDFQNFSGRSNIDLRTYPLSPDGYRNLSGELITQVTVPHEMMEHVRTPGVLTRYRCEPVISDDPQREIYTITEDTSGGLSRPEWARGTGSGTLRGDILLPASGGTTPPVQTTDRINPSVIENSRVRIPTNRPFPTPIRPGNDGDN